MSKDIEERVEKFRQKIVGENARIRQLEDACKKAARTGNIKDLREYLKMRRDG